MSPFFPTWRVVANLLLVAGVWMITACPAHQEPAESPETPSASPPADEIRADELAADRRSPPSSAIETALNDIQVKQKCNRVMGCPAEEVLLSEAGMAVAPILELLSNANPNQPFYARLIEVLGKIGDDRPAAFLRKQLDSSKWLIRAKAAIALGRLGDKGSQPLLIDLLEREGLDPGSRAAAAFALVQFGDTVQKDVIASLLTPRAVETQNWGYTTLVAELAGELEVTAAQEGLRLATRHRDYFLRRAAIAALSRMKDRGAIRVLISRLDDEIPSIRRDALKALRTLTGESWTTDLEWRVWCEAQGCP